MGIDRLEAAVPDGEALRHVTERRRSCGAVGFTDERLLVVGDDVTSVEFASIDEVSARQVDWFVAVLSVALVGVGLRSGLENPLAGVALVAAGIVSLVLVYRKRGKVTVSVHGRGKPLEFHVGSTDEFLERLGDRLDRYEERLAEERPAEERPAK